MPLLPVFRQCLQGQTKGTGGQIGHSLFAQHEKTPVLNNQCESFGALLMGPANMCFPVN